MKRTHSLIAGVVAGIALAAAVTTYAQPYGDLLADFGTRLSALIPPGAHPSAVAEAITHLVGLPSGTRPLRTHVDPSKDGSEVEGHFPATRGQQHAARSQVRTLAVDRAPHDVAGCRRPPEGRPP